VKAHIDNEMDFYLGAVMATILEKYTVYAVMEGGFTKEQIISSSPHAAKYISIDTNIKREY
jgi:hypothetical protein